MKLVKLVTAVAIVILLLPISCAERAETRGTPTAPPSPQAPKADLREPHYATPAIPCYGIQTAPEYGISVVMAQPLEEPTDMAFSPDGSPYFIGCHSYSIKKVSPDGKVSTVTTLQNPASTIACSPKGELFVGGFEGIWKVWPPPFVTHQVFS